MGGLGGGYGGEGMGGLGGGFGPGGMAGGGGLARIDMANNHDVDVGLFLSHFGLTDGPLPLQIQHL